ncbi:hypothetical protein GCM10009611_17030 [Arthrobacter roseus]
MRSAPAIKDSATRAARIRSPARCTAAYEAGQIIDQQRVECVTPTEPFPAVRRSGPTLNELQWRVRSGAFEQGDIGFFPRKYSKARVLRNTM